MRLKSIKVYKLVANLDETFQFFYEFDMRPNLEKCASIQLFWFGFMVT